MDGGHICKVEEGLDTTDHQQCGKPHKTSQVEQGDQDRDETFSAED